MLLTYEKKPKKLPDLSNMTWLRQVCIRVTNSKYFEIFILISIMINTVALASHHFMISQSATKVIESLNSFFVAVFSLEAVIKLIALKMDYFKDAWNKFDFIVLFITLAMLIPISMGLGKNFQGLVSVLRVLRVCRIFKVVVRAEKMMVIYKTLADTGPVLGSFGLLLFILLFMFTTVSVQLFALVDLKPIDGIKRQLGEHTNFRDFATAFLTLFRCSSGEAWNNIMFETSWSHSILFQCRDEDSYE